MPALDAKGPALPQPAGIDQETWALLTVYQALIRAAADTAATRPGLDTDRISFTILLQTAADLVTTATGILPDGPPDLAGQIGRAALADCSPPGAGPAPNHAPARIPPPSTATPLNRSGGSGDSIS